MNVSIQIHYKGDSKLTQGGTFYLRGKKVEQVALEFWQQIQKDMSYHAVLEKVILNGELDITEKVMEFEILEWRKKNEAVDDLPF
ncbi:hypothetical protein [Neobacillus massiliamazoniensis]|uniref:Uncharacterized protein n=1 Tax=Neobacillus massiliamazoniensis TaxID=1499688 RepID=A0A0U1NZJ4_9BACI|nr:hypothetical protein [Neobacillus massiliamazoniensis]CRK83413.1 hypothetical protein BN000_03381 [Neobacillus massiliamazoniensis]